jgi:hypothetical protein
VRHRAAGGGAQLDHLIGAVQLGEQVGHDHHGPALVPPAAGALPEVQVGAVVEALIRLVKQQQPGLADQGQGQAELLPGPAGQVTHQRPAGQREAERVQQIAPLGRRAVASRGEQADVLGGGEQVEQGGLLRAVPGRGAAPHGARAGGLQARADSQQRGLARAVLPGDRQHLARPGLQADVAEHRPPAVGLAKAGHGEQGRGLGGGRGAGLGGDLGIPFWTG